MSWSELRHAFRVLRKHRQLSVLIVVALGACVGTSTALFALVDAAFIKPFPVSESDRIVAVFTTGSDETGYASVSYEDFIDYSATKDVFANLASYARANLSTSGSARAHRVRIEGISASYLGVLGIKPALGRVFRQDEVRIFDPRPVALLSHEYWRDELASDANVVGSVIRLGSRPYTIVGVLPVGFKGVFLNSQPAPKLWVPLPMFFQALGGDASSFEGRERRNLSVIGRLQEGVSIDEARAGMQVVSDRLQRDFAATNTGRSAILLPLREARVWPTYRDEGIRFATFLLLIAGSVFVVAAANIVNVLIAWQQARRTEFSIRMALGASRRRLVTLSIVESMLLSIAGGASGVAVAYLMRTFLPLLQLPPLIPRVEVVIDSRVILFSIGLTLLAGLACGAAPALLHVRRGAIRGAVGWRAMGQRTRHGSLVLQIALCMVVLVDTSLLLQTVRNLQRVDIGYREQNIALASIDVWSIGYDEEQGLRLYAAIADQIRSMSGVQSVAIAHPAPLTRAHYMEAVRIDEDEEAVPVGPISANYTNLMGLPIVAGRAFFEQEPSAVVMVNETMATRFWPNGSPVGERIRGLWDDTDREVVGVVRDAKYRTVWDDAEPYMYVPFEQYYTSEVSFHVKVASNPTRAMIDIASKIRDVNPDVPVVGLRTMDSTISESLSRPRMIALFATIFAVLTLILVVIGVYGLVSYSVEQQAPQIGLRLAIGADGKDILTFVMTRTVLVAGLGSLIGLVVARASVSLLEALVYGITSMDHLGTFGTVAAFLVGVAAFAAYLPARQAVRLDPATILRQQSAP